MELFVGREVLRAGLTSLRASFTVSLQGEYQSFLVVVFFCWRLLGLIPGGAPFSQLNKGVKFDAMVESTDLVECQLMTKTCKKAIIKKQNTTYRRKIKRETIHRFRTGMQKRALVKSYRQHLRRSNR